MLLLKYTQYKKGRVCDLTFEIEEGKRYLLIELTYPETSKLLTKVIRRELELCGDPFNSVKLRQRKKC